MHAGLIAGPGLLLRRSRTRPPIFGPFPNGCLGTGGGSGPPLTSGPELAVPLGLRLQWVLERAGSLYLRYGSD